MNGIDAVKEIRRTYLEVKVIFLTMHPDETFAIKALETRAQGYVLKHKYQIMKSTGLKTVADLVGFAVKHGIVNI